MFSVEGMIVVCLAFIAYTYLLYPLALAAGARLRPQPIRQSASANSLSIVIAARNEQQTIGRRIRELSRMLNRTTASGEIILISDGSTDRTVAEARAAAPGIRIIELPASAGKAAALNAGVAAASSEILVFADARQTWAEDALERLVENFGDPRVGAASGELIVESEPGVMAGVGLYWRYEKWIRKNESRVGSLAGVTGAICAVRRRLFQPLPSQIVAEDIYWPMQIAMQGFRVVHDERAVAFDRLPLHARDEFRRKVRTLSGNYQLIQRLPSALLPWRNPAWMQLVSHKLLRLAIPWLLLALMGMTWFVHDLELRRPLLAMQLAFYGLAVAGAMPGTGRVAAAASAFALLNSAAWFAFWVWLFGGSTKSWRAVQYPGQTLAQLRAARARAEA